jgi:hypothetical protein
MLDSVTATIDHAVMSSVSCAERDEFGAIAGRVGLFTAPLVPCALAGHDNLGRRLDRWTPDGDLL